MTTLQNIILMGLKDMSVYCWNNINLTPFYGSCNSFCYYLWYLL